MPEGQRLWVLLLRAGTGPVDIVSAHVLGHPLGVDWAVAPWGYVTILLVDVWQWTSFMFFVLLVGLSSVPPELHEAADIDGARPIRTMRSITLPLIVPYIVTAVVVRIIDAAKLFEVPYTLTGGHPGLDHQQPDRGGHDRASLDRARGGCGLSSSSPFASTCVTALSVSS